MSNLRSYLNRSSRLARDATARVLQMQGAEPPSRAPLTLFTLTTPEVIKEYAYGCDADIGARFHGVMSLAVRPGYEEQIRGSYAGFRNKFRPTLFGELMDDVSNHRFLALRVRVAGHPRTRHSYFVNIQTEGPTDDDLWQHRLYPSRRWLGRCLCAFTNPNLFIFWFERKKNNRSHSKDL
ncbi:hypothetical protein BGW80DRAFT_1402825 [Lactifluus volemus]|nr:hypothetical protein BGW80DRAFT_1402825 [Lactifluus volemus]